MKILVAIDGSEHTRVTTRALLQRPWPSGTEVRVISVVQLYPVIVGPDGGVFAEVPSIDEVRQRASRDVSAVAAEIKNRGLQVSTAVLEGSPKRAIVEEALRWHADLIFVGSHGHGPIERFLLGSIAHAVALHAPCSVEIVREAKPTST
jgi:nucleotide-binding universal stress UspA family protein